MNSRRRVENLIARKKADRCGFWLGNPDEASWKLYFRYYATDSRRKSNVSK